MRSSIACSGYGKNEMASPIISISLPSTPEPIRSIAKDQRQESCTATPQVLRGMLMLGVLMAIVVFFGSGAAIYLILPRFAAAIPVVGVLLISKATAIIFQITLTDLTSRGRGMLCSLISILVLPFGIIGYMTLIPRFGIMGAALGCLGAYTMESVVSLYWFSKVTGISPWKALIPSTSDFVQVWALLGRLKHRNA